MGLLLLLCSLLSSYQMEVLRLALTCSWLNSALLSSSIIICVFCFVFLLCVSILSFPRVENITFSRFFYYATLFYPSESQTTRRTTQTTAELILTLTSRDLWFENGTSYAVVGGGRPSFANGFLTTPYQPLQRERSVSYRTKWNTF